MDELRLICLSPTKTYEVPRRERKNSRPGKMGNQAIALCNPAAAAADDDDDDAAAEEWDGVQERRVGWSPYLLSHNIETLINYRELGVGNTLL